MRDVTDFRHPGGDTIAHYQDGQDATDAFETFHRRSSVAEQRLRSLPVVKNVIIEEPWFGLETAGTQPQSRRASAALDPAGAAISRDFRNLRDELSAEGLFSLHSYPTLHFVGCYLLHDIALYALALYLVASGWVACGMVMRAFAHVQRGGTMHDLAHNEVFAKSRAADLCYMVYCTLAMGFSAHEWRTKHNRHHTSPNMEGFDGNVEQLPLFGWNSGWTKRMTARMQKVQLYVWYAVTPLLGLTMQIRGLLWALRHELTTELRLMTAHFIIDYSLFGYCLWLQLGFSPEVILGYYLVSQATAGVYIHLIFMYGCSQPAASQRAGQPV
jgi:fatty acid desaturase